MDISVGIDIATSVSIIAAAASYVYQSHKESERRRSEYFVSELKEIFEFLKQHRWKYANLITSFHHSPPAESTESQTNAFIKDFRVKMHENNKELHFELLNFRQSVAKVFAGEQELKALDEIYENVGRLLKLANEGDFNAYLQSCYDHDQNLIIAMSRFAEFLKKRLG